MHESRFDGGNFVFPNSVDSSKTLIRECNLVENYGTLLRQDCAFVTIYCDVTYTARTSNQ